MKAFVMKEIGQVGFMDKPLPEPGPHDAVVKTTRALICTSDSHTVHGGIGPRENLTLGHEAVGVVHEVGSAVQVFRPGDCVVVGAITPAGGTRQPRADKTIATGLCPGGGRVDPTLMTMHTFSFDEMEQAFEVSDQKLDGVIKPLITF